jgi:hypothetical protein
MNQEKQLQEARISIKTDALLMKKALVLMIYIHVVLKSLSYKQLNPTFLKKDKLELSEGIRHAANMLNKLSNIARIGNTDISLSLSPKNYYELCNR